MTYGLLLNKNDGSVLIDQDFSCYFMLQQGVATANTTVNFANQPNGCIIAVRGIPDTCVISLKAQTTNSFVAGGYVASTDFRTLNNFSFEYRIYALAVDNPPALSYGLQVFDAHGRTVFDSMRTYLRIDSVKFWNRDTWFSSAQFWGTTSVPENQRPPNVCNNKYVSIPHASPGGFWLSLQESKNVMGLAEPTGTSTYWLTPAYQILSNEIRVFSRAYGSNAYVVYGNVLQPAGLSQRHFSLIRD